MRARVLFIALLLALSLAPAHVIAGPWLPSRGEYYSELRGGHFISRTYYDWNGARYPFATGGDFENRSISVYNEFGWKPWMSVVLAAPILSNTRNTGHFQRTETGLGDLLLGFRIRLHGGSTPAALQLEWSAPLGYETRDDSLVGAPSLRDSVIGYGSHPPIFLSAPLGLGIQSATARLQFGSALRLVNGFVTVDAGYRAWSKPYEDQIVGSAQLGTWLGSSLLLLGHYDGALALGTKATLTSQLTLVPTPGPAPAWIEEHRLAHHEIGPELRYRVDDRLDVFAGSTHTMAGKNWFHVDEYYVGLAFRQTKLNRLQGLLGNKTRP